MGPDVVLSLKLFVVAKGSYLQKYKESQGINYIQPERKHYSVTEDQKKIFEEGQLLLIDKPLHWTSFDVVRKIRNSIGIKKVGHAGTLDPLASGLLIVCTGKFTKKINELMVKEKTYTGTITVGATTATYDKESIPENQRDYSYLTDDQLNEKTKGFLGSILQKPPIYSAIKKEGTALYELARRGEEVDPEPREVTIHEFKISRIALPEIDFIIRCSTGTYIRSIAHDFGKALGCGGYLSALRRTAIGEYSIKDAVTVETFLGGLQVKTDS
jgi:tRNA pseudouridine55 synthase